MSVTPKQASDQALEYARTEMDIRKPVIDRAFQYEGTYMFTIQPEGVDRTSSQALLDSFVAIDSETGGIVPFNPFSVPDFPKKAEEMPEDFYT